MRGWLTGLVGWCAVFAVPHLYWAAGGRAGLGASAADADAAFATPWFAAYNAATVVLCLAGIGLGVVDLSGLSGRTRLAVRFRRVLLVLGVLLALRGAVGVTGLALEAATTGGVSSPPVLVAVEGWFLLGAVVLLGLARAGRRPL
ncbi:hypothetical protein [uncultured Nocardioides sp.]|uniref:hypothetical protein n=1 Tax=uncultured Nocardioides sp. TaxID=198441 RepID=UPI002613F8DA|nr:hypothetical protein [uncultured Nocardioides sp.]